MRTLLLLLLCLPAYAAPLPPFPTVKRPAPLLSPKAASAPKSTPMLKFVPASELPRVPMTAGGTYTAEGEFYFVVAAFKAKNTGLLMHFSTQANGPWFPLAGWGPYPEDQWVSGMSNTKEPKIFIRATPGAPVAATGGRALETTSFAETTAIGGTMFPGRFIKLPPSKTKPVWK